MRPRSTPRVLPAQTDRGFAHYPPLLGFCPHQSRSAKLCDKTREGRIILWPDDGDTSARASNPARGKSATPEQLPPLNRALALDRDPVHQPPPSVVIVDRVVLDRTVVPERQRPRLPTEPASEFGAHRMIVEIVQQRRALCLGHVLEAQREGAVDVGCLSAGLAMGANDWMLDLVVRLLAESEADRGGTVFLGARRVAAVRPPGAVYCSQPVEHPLHAVRQRLIGEILVREQRVAAVFRRF